MSIFILSSWIASMIAIEACEARKAPMKVSMVSGNKPSSALMPKFKKAIKKQVANIHQYINNGESFDLVHGSVKLFKKLREEIKSRNVSKATTEEKKSSFRRNKCMSTYRSK